MSVPVIYGVYAVLLLLTLLPVLSLVTALAVARLLGCRLSEANAQPCPCLGRDIGGALYVMCVMGWLTLLTVPVGLGLIGVWSVVVWII